MTAREIDQLLQAWNQRLTSGAQNLVDLRDQRAYRKLAGIGMPPARVEGETAARAAPAIEAMPRIFDYFELLRMKIGQAAALFNDLPVFGAENRLREVERLLLGPSIKLETSPGSVTPISPSDLLKLLNQTFETARNTLQAIDSAWSELESKLDHFAAESVRLRRAAAELSLPLPSDIDTLAVRLPLLRARIPADPLGCEREAAVLTQSLDKFRLEVEVVRQEMERLEQSFRDARSLLGEIAAAHIECKAVLAERRAKVSELGVPAEPQPEADIKGLEEWLVRLERKRVEGLRAPLHTGLSNWCAAAGKCLSSERQALALNRAAIDAHEELLGRLSALKAKALAYGLMEHPQLSALAGEAKKSLQSRPSPIGQATALVARFELALTALTSKLSGGVRS